MKPIANFEDVPFLAINGQTLSLATVLQSLQRSGRLLPLLREIVEQHVLLAELQHRNDLEVSRAAIDQAVVDFRVQSNLTDPAQFQQWLASQGMDYSAFQSRVLFSAKLEKLVEHIAAPQLESYFEQHRPLLAQVDLSCIITADRDLAVSLHAQLVNGEIHLEGIFQRYALADREQVNVLRGLIRRGKLAPELRAAVDTATAGELVGPIAVDNRWCLFQVGARMPAVLDGDLKQELQRQLFQQWLVAKIQPLTVQLAHQDRVQPESSEKTGPTPAIVHS